MKLFAFLIIFIVAYRSWAVPGTLVDIQKLPPEFRKEALAQLQKYQNLQKTDPTLNLDLDDGAVVSVYSKPGIFNPAQCEEDDLKNKKNPNNQCQSIGWPDNKSEVQSTGQIEFRIEKDQDGNEFLQTYAEVKFSYERKGKRAGTGWIAEDYISFKPTAPSYADVVVSKVSQAQDWIKKKYNEVCNPSTEVSAADHFNISQKSNLTDLAKISDKINEDIQVENIKRKTVSEIAAVLSKSVGKCVLIPPNKAPQSFLGNLAYDQFVLPALKKEALPAGIKKENNQSLTQQDLMDIDALSRTMFGEMASCTPIGAQYPMAVARVILNREEAMKKDKSYIAEFIKNNSEHDPSKSLLSRAATSPVLFSTWNQEVIDFDELKNARILKATQLQRKKKISKIEALAEANKEIKPNSKTSNYYKKNDSGLLHTLCPPSDPNGICYTGGKPDENFNSVWQNIVKVATEAVLFPKQFEAKTAELTGIKHYTSNRSQFYNFIQVHPSIEGRKISSQHCLNLWRPPTAAEKKAMKQRTSSRHQL